jgi:hypothetical protein
VSAAVQTEPLQVRRLDTLEREHRRCSCTGFAPCDVYEAAWLALRALDAQRIGPIVCGHGPGEACETCVTDDEWDAGQHLAYMQGALGRVAKLRDKWEQGGRDNERQFARELTAAIRGTEDDS